MNSKNVLIKKENALEVLKTVCALHAKPTPNIYLKESVPLSYLKEQLTELGFNQKEIKIKRKHIEELTDLGMYVVLINENDNFKLITIFKKELNTFRLITPEKIIELNIRELMSLNPISVFKIISKIPEEGAEEEKFGWNWIAKSFFARKDVIREVVLASLVVAVIGLAFPLATQAIVDKVITNQAQSTLITLGIGISLMAVFSALMGWLRQKLLLRLSNVIDNDLSGKIMKHMVSLPLSYYNGKATGTLINKIYGIERIREFMAGAFLLCVLDLPFMLIFLALMISYSIELSLVVIGFITLMSILSAITGPILRKKANVAMKLGAMLQGYATERIGSMETLKSIQLENNTHEEFKRINEAHLEATLDLKETGNTYGTIMQLLEQLQNAAVLCLGAYLAMGAGSLTIGMLVAFQMFSQRVTQPLLKLSGFWQELQQVRISAKMLGEILDQKTESYNTTKSSLTEDIGELEIKNLTFGHIKGRTPLYEKFNAIIKHKSINIITGPSGCGKSTLAKLMLGFYKDYEGEIILNGRDIKSLSVNELRANFGVVPQESVLFSGTIWENLLSCSPDCNEEEVVNACKLAGIHSEIENFSSGYNTYLSERGASLSGGQRQRLAIARAILKNPKYLIFDESTASLDEKNSEVIADTANRLSQFMTIIFIAHKIPANLRKDNHIRLAV